MELLISRLEKAAIFIAVVCLVLIMFIVSSDAVLRYAMNAPIPWAFEIVTYYLIIISVYFTLSPAFRSGDHINIGLIRSLMSMRVRAWLDFLCSALALVVFVFIAYGALHHSSVALSRNEFLPGYTMWPAWLSHLPVAIGAFLLVLRLAHHCYTLVRLGHDPYVDHADEVSE